MHFSLGFGSSFPWFPSGRVIGKNYEPLYSIKSLPRVQLFPLASPMLLHFVLFGLHSVFVVVISHLQSDP